MGLDLWLKHASNCADGFHAANRLKRAAGAGLPAAARSMGGLGAAKWRAGALPSATIAG
jgi:hypothetical protein